MENSNFLIFIAGHMLHQEMYQNMQFVVSSAVCLKSACMLNSKH